MKTHRIAGFLVSVLFFLLAAPAVCRAQDAEFWRARAGLMPIGTTVKLRTHDGHGLKAVIMAIDGSGMLVKPVTRVPEPSRRIAFDDLVTLDRYENRVSFPKYIGIGAAIAGSVFLTLLAIDW